ncbi:MAG: aconitate hydratase [Anaerofustis stercorihominis]|nr:aconitate hydratase [Anaerofustis stercorihominis]
MKEHLVSGTIEKGSPISIKIDKTLTQDSTGTMAYLQYEAISDEPVKTECSVAYIDHNMLQSGPENMDDHIYIQTIADKSGVIFSRPGNGICHRLNLDRFSAVGKTLLGSDSHTPTCGAVAMIAIGAGGLDVAAAMAGGAYFLNMPEVVGVELTGALRPGVGAKDVILEVLRILSVKGGVGKVIEYFGEGVKNLSVSQRATITNMGAELGATTSVFPADERVEEFFIAQDRINDFKYLAADDGCSYDQIVKIDMSALEPLAAMPHSPDNVKKVKDIEGIKLNQIIVGSCTNSSYEDLVTVAKILDGKTVHKDVSFAIAPGSKQVLKMLADEGYLSMLIESGARLLECGCGPCIGMGQSPNSAGVSLRTFNRNFKGRSGTVDADVYLISPEVAAVSAITGVLTDPMRKVDFVVDAPKSYPINDNMFIYPSKDKNTPVVKGPNIKPFPKAYAPKEELVCPVITKLGDNITTDDIMPSNAKLLPYRSNIEHLSNFCLTPVDEAFPEKAKKEENGSVILAGENYGQGSSREHAALAPLYLSVKAVLAKSFARIHKSNLINNGILPLVFVDTNDYDRIDEYDVVRIADLIPAINEEDIIVENTTKNETYKVKLIANERERMLLSHGGLINYLKTI